MHPALESKRVKKRISQMINNEADPTDFLDLVDELKNQRREGRMEVRTGDGKTDWVEHNRVMLHAKECEAAR